MFRALDLIRPDAFIIENVAGLERGKTRPYFLELVHVLDDVLGYEVKTKTLNGLRARHRGPIRVARPRARPSDPTCRNGRERSRVALDEPEAQVVVGDPAVGACRAEA
jgi:hypothetical protein